MATAAAEAARVAKKQRTTASSSEDALQQLIDAVGQAQARLQEPGSDVAATLQDLHSRLAQLNLAARLAADTKELHGAVSRLGKVVDRHFSLDICKAVRETELDAGALNQVVAEHLYHEGHFAIGDEFVAEAGVPNGTDLKQPYASMHTVLQALQARNLQPALDWVHKAELAGPGGEPSSLEFVIHRVAFLQLLNAQGQAAALAYGRAHFPRFHASNMPQIQRLLGALCYAKRAAAGQRTPYADLFALEELWAGLQKDFVRQCCALLGQAQDSPLLVAVAAGSAALPTLLKLASLAAVQPLAEQLAGEQLPVEIPLGREFCFQSVFACPVSRDQSTSDNPPMLLPCGHCISHQSIMKIAKAANRVFKCPYCPHECTPASCQQLHF